MAIRTREIVRRCLPWRAVGYTEDGLVPEALDAALRKHAFEAWYPRCVDHVNGGFLCDFDRRWRPAGQQVRLLEFQARQTRVAALALRLGMDAEVWAPICRHGFAYLRDVMWDAEHGGWYGACDLSGSPRESGEKHSHGIAYAILSCLDISEVLQLPEARRLACDAFAWLDSHAWDRDHGGYWGWLRRDGTPYATLAHAAPRTHDHIGVPLGAKDANVNGDMIESLTELCRDEAERVGRDRLARLVDWFERTVQQHRRLPVHFTRALEPIGDFEHSGYELQAGYRLPQARARLGAPLALGPIEHLLRAHALAHCGPTGGPAGFERREEWWITFEWLHSSAFAASLGGDEACTFLDGAGAAWRRIQRDYLDSKYGGVYMVPQRRDAPSSKGDCWKDASHEAFALSAAAGYIRGKP